MKVQEVIMKRRILKRGESTHSAFLLKEKEENLNEARWWDKIGKMTYKIEKMMYKIEKMMRQDREEDKKVGYGFWKYL